MAKPRTDEREMSRRIVDAIGFLLVALFLIGCMIFLIAIGPIPPP
jgi:hypothetical protein